jgi:hypothetical protein
MDALTRAQVEVGELFAALDQPCHADVLLELANAR